MAGSAPVPAVVRVRIWDAPVRLVHWLMVLLMAISWRTAETGQMEYHRYSGYVLLGLLLFRIYWGFVGSSTARFTSFIRGPSAIFAYLRRLPARVQHHDPSVPGHNPLGALSVVALLGLLLAQVGLGLFTVDVDGIESGPLSMYVTFETGRTCARLHDTVFEALLWFVGFHVVAVLFYLVYKKQNLVGSMVHGRRVFPATQVPSIAPASPLRLIVGIVIAAITVWLVARAFQF